MALIAFGGLTEKDVTPGRVLVQQRDVEGHDQQRGRRRAVSSTISGQSKEADTSPRGIVWPPMPADDKEGWARVHKKAPYFVPQKATCGAGGLSPQTPVEMAGYAYPIFMTYADRAGRHDPRGHQGDDRHLRRATRTARRAPTAWRCRSRTCTWVVPYHDGAIRAFKEKGVWSDAAQKHNDALIKRQATMADAWKAYGGTAPSDDKAFAEGWMKARAAALAKAGMDVVFE